MCVRERHTDRGREESDREKDRDRERGGDRGRQTDRQTERAQENVKGGCAKIKRLKERRSKTRRNAEKLVSTQQRGTF